MFRVILVAQITACLLVDLVWGQSPCTRVQRFGQATGVVQAVSRIRNSIGYSGLSSLLLDHVSNTTDGSCIIKLASIQNKAGEIVRPSAESAQSAVRSRANTLLFKSACPGFGMCADVLDAEEYDVWPITAMTVRFT
jgi:ABC-type phosphate transport system substrate-binding protein